MVKACADAERGSGRYSPNEVILECSLITYFIKNINKSFENSPFIVFYSLTVLARVRGGATMSKYSTFQIFPNFGRGGGGHRKSIFSQIQKSPNYPRVGGVKKIMDFFHNLGHFLLRMLPLANMQALILLRSPARA